MKKSTMKFPGQPRPQGAFTWLWGRGGKSPPPPPPPKAREKRPGDEVGFPGYLFFENTRKNLKLNLVLVFFLVLESKGLYCDGKLLIQRKDLIEIKDFVKNEVHTP